MAIVDRADVAKRTRRMLAGTAAIGLAAGFPSVLAGAVGMGGAATQPSGAGGHPARRIILLIGDGMGDSQITMARNYSQGAAGRLAMDRLPFTGEYTTYALSKDDPAKPEYVTDSAAAGTAWATGRKTRVGAISVAPDGTALPTIVDLARRAGYRTGDVTTAELTDATPAVLAAHVSARSCQGPADMAACPRQAKERGGPGSIAEQELAHGVDVLLGGGQQRFDQTVRGGPFARRRVTDQARSSGYAIVTDRAGLAAAQPGRKLLGLFASGNMAPEWSGPVARLGGTPPSRCRPNPDRPRQAPHLAEMTRAAIRLLDADSRADAGRGFFLQVEGAAINTQAHEANPCGQIGDTVEFDRAVDAALAYAANHPDTLVIVTADHGHASEIVPPDADTGGRTATLLTADDAAMTIAYASAVPGGSAPHSGTQVRVAAQGPGAADVVGVGDQTNLFATLARALGVAEAAPRS